MDIFLVVIFGLVIGSFLNVCICRIANEESIAFPPSHCTNCGYELKAKDLIPVLSYIFLGGKCRSCKEKISIQYPIVEILNAILYIAIYLKFGFTLNLFNPDLNLPFASIKKLSNFPLTLFSLFMLLSANSSFAISFGEPKD